MELILAPMGVFYATVPNYSWDRMADSIAMGILPFGIQ